jgi:hypothetical protein
MLDGLRFGRFRFHLQCLTAIDLGTLPGSTLRGAFGGVFRNQVCLTRQPACTGCLLRSHCSYGYLFEPSAKGTGVLQHEQAPRPFIFEAPEEARQVLQSGDTLVFTLVLIGRAIELLPYFVFVFHRLEETGLGRGRHHDQGRFRLVALEAEQPGGGWQPVFDPASQSLVPERPVFTTEAVLRRATQLSADRLQMHFLTPLRLYAEGRLIRNIEAHHVIRALLRRLSVLLAVHCGQSLELDFPAVVAHAETIRSKAHFTWQQQGRYSSRQQRVIEMDGYTGTLTLWGTLAPLLPLLAAGEWLHVGKGCVMGLGRYHLSVP